MHVEKFHIMLLSVILWLNSLPVFISDLVPVNVSRGKFVLEVIGLRNLVNSTEP